MLECDCNLYQLKQFIQNLTNYVDPYIFRNTLLPDKSDFQSWKCKLNPMLGQGDNPMSFLDVSDENFICINKTVMDCPKDCECFSHYDRPDYYIKCVSRGLKSFPRNIPIPPSGAKLVVSLAQNSISVLPECTSTGYQWLWNVTSLNLEDNPIMVKDNYSKPYCSLDYLLRCLKSVEGLYLAETGIEYLPQRIKDMRLKRVSLPNHELICDCSTKWLKKWFQQNDFNAHGGNKGNLTIIEGYQALYCEKTGECD